MIPKPMIDMAEGGYPLVALYCVGITVGMALFAALIVLFARIRIQAATFT